MDDSIKKLGIHSKLDKANKDDHEGDKNKRENKRIFNKQKG